MTCILRRLIVWWSYTCHPRVGAEGRLASSIPENGGILIQNLGATVLDLGGPTVTANTTATGGVQIAASPSAPVLVPTTGAGTESIYGVSTAAVNLAFLYPG